MGKMGNLHEQRTFLTSLTNNFLKWQSSQPKYILPVTQLREVL